MDIGGLDLVDMDYPISFDRPQNSMPSSPSYASSSTTNIRLPPGYRQFPLSPQSSTHGRGSLSDISEGLESILIEQQNTPQQQPRIAHPEYLPDPSTQQQRVYASYCLRDFTMHRTLGTGSFGRVHLVRSTHNARFYAIKVLQKEKIVRTKQVEHTRSEHAMLDAVHHPFIVNLWGTFQDHENLYMVMDFVAGGELFSLLRKSKRFPDPVAKFYAAEVSLALHYLHSRAIVYRDLKPENILLASDGHIKITDFGFAKLLEESISPGGVTWTLCGTPDYLAPEIVEGKPYGKSVDWYALGVLIFEMLAGYPPFWMDPTLNSNPVTLYQRISVGLPSVQFPSAFNPLAVDLIHRFMTKDVSERYGNMKHGMEDIFAHPWFAEVVWAKIVKKEITAPYVPAIVGDGDASQFESYQEMDLPYTDSSTMFPPPPDPFGSLFPDFEYTA